jgi:hypothetical protein
MKRRSWMIVVFGVAAIYVPAAAYDTGHHRDLTVLALRAEGFTAAAADIAALQNWVTDFYAGHSVVPEEVPSLGATVRSSLLPYAFIVDQTEKLHFDNLRGPEAVQKYWERLTFNMKCAVFAEAGNRTLLPACPPFSASRAGRTDVDPVAFLTLLGISLHAVQDFYSHSNWVEILQSEQKLPPARFHTDVVRLHPP